MTQPPYLEKNLEKLIVSKVKMFLFKVLVYKILGNNLKFRKAQFCYLNEGH